MKHIKSINEGWFNTMIPKKVLPLWEQIKDISELVFPEYLTDDEIVNIEVNSNNEEDNKNYLKITTNQIDEEGNDNCYVFVIYSKDSKIYFKAIGYGGFHTDAFYSFDEMNYPIHSEEELEEIINLFARKLKPFITYIIQMDK